jgi:hypothetical protein
MLSVDSSESDPSFSRSSPFFAPDSDTLAGIIAQLQVGWTHFNYYQKRQRTSLLTFKFITQDSMKFSVLTAVLAACAVSSSLVRFKIALSSAFPRIV